MEGLPCYWHHRSCHSMGLVQDLSGKRQFLCTSWGIIHLNGSGHNSNEEPLILFSAISNNVPGLFTLFCCWLASL